MFNHSFLFAPWTNLRISCWLQPHCFHEKLIWIVWFHSPFPFFPAQSFIRAKLHDRRRREYMRNLICMKPSHSPVLHLLYFFIFSLLKESGLNKVRKLHSTLSTVRVEWFLGTTSKEKNIILNGHCPCPFSSDPSPPPRLNKQGGPFFGPQKRRFSA